MPSSYVICGVCDRLHLCFEIGWALIRACRTCFETHRAEHGGMYCAHTTSLSAQYSNESRLRFLKLGALAVSTVLICSMCAGYGLVYSGFCVYCGVVGKAVLVQTQGMGVYFLRHVSS
jgi:hypothetical protein